jgi:hypothetical protein
MPHQSDDHIVAAHPPSPAFLTRMGMRMEEMERYINYLESLRDEQCDRIMDERKTHAEELEMQRGRLEELQTTVDFQSNMLEIMGNDLERLQEDNDRLRVENQELMEEKLQDSTERIRAWHYIQEDLMEYIKCIEV